MEATNGLGIILENRYYGHSYPFEHSSTDNLRFNTIEQCLSIEAMEQHQLHTDGISSRCG